MVNFTLCEKLVQDYTLAKIKHIIENALFIKSSYIYVPTILTHNRNPVKVGIKSNLFRMNSVTDQKYEVTLLQQSLTRVLNESLPQWSIGLFRTGFKINDSSETYCRPIILKCTSGSSGKSSLARFGS